MRKLKLIEHVSLDGIIQAGSDTDGGFTAGDRSAPYRSPAGLEMVLSEWGERFDRQFAKTSNKMTSMEMLSEYFKPEIRKNGEDYFRKDLIYLLIAADTQIRALVKAGTGARVHLKSQAISSSNIEAHCSCPAFSKGQLCKHILATLLAVEMKHPDFLESKTEIVAAVTEESAEQSARKAKQTEFKKVQSARLKERNKQQRLQRKKSLRPSRRAEASISPEIQAALDYFDQNGFALKDSLDEKSILLAKRELSRIYHPDKGGSHEEFLTLNRHCETLLKSLG